MQTPELRAFFNGVFDLLMAAFRASEEMSAASKGTIRERAARDVLRSLAPPFLQIEQGDIVDAWGEASGQLDGVVIDARAPALKLSPSDPAIILAESAIAVLECKSDLAGHWEDQVAPKFEKIAKLRPAIRRVPGLAQLPPEILATFSKPAFEHFQGRIDGVRDEQRRIPLYVVGRTGWTSPDTFAHHVDKIQAGRPPTDSPFVLAITLDPPALARGHAGRPTRDRGQVLGLLWMNLVEEAQRLFRFRGPVPWSRYIGGPETAKVVNEQTDPNVDWISDVPFEELPKP